MVLDGNVALLDYTLPSGMTIEPDGTKHSLLFEGGFWKRQGGGIVINVTSSAGHTETPAPIGQGGWGLGYSLTKAAFGRTLPKNKIYEHCKANKSKIN